MSEVSDHSESERHSNDEAIVIIIFIIAIFIAEFNDIEIWDCTFTQVLEGNPPHPNITKTQK